nr:MAG TPA: minor tail protein [Caudoviricetes sp.]
MAGSKTISIGVKLDLDEKGFKNLVGNCEEFAKLMEASASKTQGLNKSLINFASAATSVATLKNALADVQQTLNGITDESRGFSDAMRATNTMAGKGAEDLGKLRRQVSDLADSVPVARDALAQGLYQVISNGVPEDNWITFLEKSARSSVGGIASLNSVVGVTSTVIKNYGKSWDEAGEIQDKIQLTAKNGVTSFEQLAATLPRVTGLSATLNVSIDELMASFATLTGVSGNTAEVSTQLAAVFNALVKPTSEATKMAQQMGIEFNASAITAAGGFQQFLSKLDQSVQQYAASSGMLAEEIYGKLFSSAESLRAIIPLQGELRDKFTANISAMQESAGTMDAAFNDMAETGTSATQRLKNEFSAFGDFANSIVTPVRPMINFSLTVLQASANVGMLVTSTRALMAATQGSGIMKLVTVVGLYSTSTGRATIATLGLSAAVTGAQAGARAAAVAFRGLMVSLGVFAAIGAAVWGVTRAIQRMRGETEKAARTEDALGKVRESVSVKLEEQKLKIQQLIKTAEDERVSMDKRLKAVNELNKTIPGYNANIDKTTGAYRASKNALDAYIQSLQKQMMMEAAKQQLQDLMNKKAQLLVQQAKYDQAVSRKQQKVSVAEEQYNTAQAANLQARSMGTNADYQQDQAGRNLSNARTELVKFKGLAQETADAIKAVDDQAAALNRALGGSFMPDLTGDGGAGGGLGAGVGSSTSGNSGTSKKPVAPEGSLQALKDQVSDIEAKIRFSTDPNEINTLLAQKQQLEQSIDIRVRYMNDKENIDAATEKAEIPVDVDRDSLKDSMQLINADFKKTNAGSKSLMKNMDGVVSSARSAASAFSGLGEAMESPELNIAGIIMGAIANVMAGYAQASVAASETGNPWVWAAFAIAGLAEAIGVVSQIKAATAFAEGGIVSGPTYALVGEYAGARNNPEVIAPLNKLRDLMPEAGGAPVVLDHEIVIDASKLKILLRNADRRDSFVGLR